MRSGVLLEWNPFTPERPVAHENARFSKGLARLFDREVRGIAWIAGMERLRSKANHEAARTAFLAASSNKARSRMEIKSDAFH